MDRRTKAFTARVPEPVFAVLTRLAEANGWTNGQLVGELLRRAGVTEARQDQAEAQATPNWGGAAGPNEETEAEALLAVWRRLLGERWAAQLDRRVTAWLTEHDLPLTPANRVATWRQVLAAEAGRVAQAQAEVATQARAVAAREAAVTDRERRAAAVEERAAAALARLGEAEAAAESRLRAVATECQAWLDRAWHAKVQLSEARRNPAQRLWR